MANIYVNIDFFRAFPKKQPQYKWVRVWGQYYGRFTVFHLKS